MSYDDINSKLFEEYMSDVDDDESVLCFLKSDECTKEMVNYYNGDGWSSLILAARQARFEVMQAMIKKGADVNYVDLDHSCNALMHMIHNVDSYTSEDEQLFFNCAKLLIDAGTDLHFKDRFSAFTMACECRRTNIIPLFLAQDVDLEWKDEDGKSGIDYLIEDNNEQALAMISSYQLHQKLSSDLGEKNSTPQRKI